LTIARTREARSGHQPERNSIFYHATELNVTDNRAMNVPGPIRWTGEGFDPRLRATVTGCAAGNSIEGTRQLNIIAKRVIGLPD
jgi:hypothetical protein